MDGDLQILRFELSDGVYGLRIEHLQEVIDIPTEPKIVPRTPLEIAGLLDLRGRIVTLLSLEVLLETPARREAGNPKAAVLCPPDSHVAFLLRGLVEIVRLPGEPALAGGDGGRNALLEGVYRDGETLVHVVDPRRLLDSVRGRIAERMKGV